MSMKNVLFIYNPVAGKMKIGGQLDYIVQFYNQHGYLVTLCQSGLLDGLEPDVSAYDLWVCCGGDGTLNRILNFLKRRNIKGRLAYIPAGSTNDFAKTIGVAGDIHKSLEQTLTGEEMRLDVGVFGDRFFLYVAAFGLFTKASYETNQKVKNRLGYVAYVLGAIKSLADVESYKLEIEAADVAIEGEFILGMITNSINIGGFNGIFYEDCVELNDGLFEAIFIRKPSNLYEVNKIITSLLNKNLLNDKFVVYLQISEIKIKSEKPIDWTLDGEYGGVSQNVEIEVLKDGLRLLCPKEISAEGLCEEDKK